MMKKINKMELKEVLEDQLLMANFMISSLDPAKKIKFSLLRILFMQKNLKKEWKKEKISLKNWLQRDHVPMKNKRYKVAKVKF